MTVICTPRLMLRHWRPEDREFFAAVNADPVVMQHFPAVLGRSESDHLADRIERDLDERGYGLWAVEVVDGAPFIGFVGLAPVPFDAHFTPATEIGWRLARTHWGQGYATEAAREAVEFAFGRLGLDEIVSFTATGNERSRRVMERLGMRREPAEDFDHPRLPGDHRLARHVLYRLRRTTPDSSISPC